MNAKIEKILERNLVRWEGMSKEALINELYEERMFFLETELEYGNEEYLDELLEEIEDEEKIGWEPILIGGFANLE
jgi:hypothetical protein